MVSQTGSQVGNIDVSRGDIAGGGQCRGEARSFAGDQAGRHHARRALHRSIGRDASPGGHHVADALGQQTAIRNAVRLALAVMDGRRMAFLIGADFAFSCDARR